MVQRVFVDSNVLVSRTLRDWLFLLRLETDQMFQLHTSFDVLIESVAAFRRRYPSADGHQSLELFERLQANLDEVLGDYSGEIEFQGKDLGDLHVHAAALECDADKLLTMNVKDFPQSDDVPYEVYHPDAFFVLIDNSAPSLVRAVTRRQNKYWQAQEPSRNATKSLSKALVEADCPEFATRVAAHVKALSGVAPRR